MHYKIILIFFIYFRRILIESTFVILASRKRYAFEGAHTLEKIIFRLASNIFTPNSYTLTVSSVLNDVSMRYRGSILSLKDNYEEVGYEAGGVSLDDYHIKEISRNSLEVTLEVVIHNQQIINKKKRISTCF